MQISGQRPGNAGGRCWSVRQAFVLTASTLTFDRSSSVLVPDLCESGARLRGRNLPNAGERLLINFGKTGLFGTVTWRGREECCVRFAQRLDAAGLEQLDREAEWSTLMGPCQSGKAVEGPTPP